MNNEELVILICQAIISLGGIFSTIMVVIRCLRALTSRSDNNDKIIGELSINNQLLQQQLKDANEQINKLSIQITKVVDHIDLTESNSYENQN